MADERDGVRVQAALLRRHGAGVAAAGARLRRVAQAERCTRLLGQLERLPACASADPWAIAWPEGALAEKTAVPASRRASLAPLPEARARARAGLAASAVAAPVRPGQPTLAHRETIAPRGLAPLPARDRAEPPAADARTAAVAAWLARNAPLPARSSATEVRDPLARRASAAHPSALNPLVPGAAAASPASAPPADADSAHSFVQRRAREAANSAPAESIPAPRGSGAPAAAAPQGGPLPAAALLQQLVAGLVPAASTAAHSHPPAAPTTPAPRAASRLLTPTAAAPAASPRGSAGAAARADAPDDSGESTAQQLNRLLIDQAWLRGVDLT